MHFHKDGSYAKALTLITEYWVVTEVKILQLDESND